MSMSNEPDVDDLLNIMKDAVHCKKNKNVDILHLASQICRRLHGLRFINCKSGKDRTGMAASLEQIQILSREYDLAEHEYQKALDAMRSEGTRIENCEKILDEENSHLVHCNWLFVLTNTDLRWVPTNPTQHEFEKTPNFCSKHHHLIII